jgi:hypothetical protein
LNKTTSQILVGFKYVYLIAFFVLLSGFFQPLIANTGFESVISGVVVLFIGLTGAILIYKSITSENRREIFLGGGFTLIAVSLFFIFQITGRV